MIVQRLNYLVFIVATVVLNFEKKCVSVNVIPSQMNCKAVECPRNCSCKRQSIHCEGLNLTYIPRISCGIKRLHFSRNSIDNVRLNTIKNLTCSFQTLSYLGLRLCKIKQLGEDVFANLTQLKEIDLSANELFLHMTGNPQSIQRALGSLSRAPLQRLTLNCLHIRDRVQELFKYLEGRYVSHLSMQKNEIIYIEDKVFENFTHLLHLNLRYNWIHKIDFSSGIPSLEVLILSDNQFNIFPPYLCDNKTGQTRYNNLRILDLSRNQIIIPLSASWNCLKMLESFNLGRNDIEEINRNFTFTKLTSLKNLTLNKMHYSLRKLGNKALESESLLHLDLSKNGLNFEDDKEVDNHVLHYLPNLRFLDVSDNIFGTVGLQKLTMLSRLKALIMKRTDLSQLPDHFLGNFPKLQHLNLYKNNIKHFTINAFQNLTKLKVLNLSENLISIFPIPPIPPATLKNLEKLDFAYNYFQCDCEIVQLQNWISDVLSDPKKHNLLSRYPDKYWCYKPQSLYHVLLKDAIPNNCNIHQLLISVICSAIVCLLFTVVLVAAFVYRWKIRLLLHKIRQTKHNEYHPLTYTFQYDTYVAYAEKDGAWVIHDLLKELEERKYKVYIRDRYSVPGVARCDEIVDNMYKSKTVIILLSKNFMACQWCNYQLNVAQARAVKLGPRFLIPVLLESVFTKRMTTSVKHLFRTSTPIDWARRSTKNKFFWSELKTALDAEIIQEFEESFNQSFCTKYGSINA